MRYTSDLYKQIQHLPHRTENRLVIAGQEYLRADIVELATSSNVFRNECPSVGNCCAGYIAFEMLAPDVRIPVAERVEFSARIVSDLDGAASEWVPRGVYYVDTRKTNLTQAGEKTTIEITGFDGLLFLENIFSVSGGWPKTDAAVLAEILDQCGLESDEVLTGGYSITQPDDDTTCRELMGHIAASYAANWISDADGKLRLVKLGAARGSTTVQRGRLATGDILSPITKVKLHKMDGNVFTAGSDGRVLNVDCPWATQQMADAILADVAGYQYRPFAAEEAICNPALEIGDDIGVGIIYAMDAAHFSGMISTLSAPPEEEINHNYPFRSGAGGVAGRAMAIAKKSNRDFKSLVAQVDTTLAGITAEVVKYGDLESAEWVYAHTSVFAAAQGARSAFDLWINGQSGGQMQSAARLVADVVEVKGRVNLSDVAYVNQSPGEGQNGGLGVRGSIVANGNLLVSGYIGSTGQTILLAGKTYEPTKITSYNPSTKQFKTVDVLGA